MLAAFFPLLAFGFTNLAMLGWLAAATAPLLIHLWSRHRFREARWAAMQFLLAAMRKNARRMQLQQWLLLAVRTLLIVLVVLALAEPYGEQLVAGGASGPVHKVLVLDGSYSMAYREAASSNFDRAKQLAAALVRESRSGDAFTVILMGEPARTIVGLEIVDRTAVAAQIESLVQPHAGADLPAALTLVDEALTAADKARSARARQEVYFFTDLQRTTWKRTGSSLTPAQSAIENQQSEIANHGKQDKRDGLHARIATLAQRAAPALIDVGQPRAANLAVTRLTTPEPFVTVDRDIALEATLHQFAEQPRSQCAVELVVDDVPVAEQTVDVPAGGEATVRFSHRFRSAGDHAIAVRAAADRLPIDDVRWLVLPAREEIRVLCVAGREGAANYLAAALNPNPAASSAIRPVIVSEGDLTEIDLSDFDCVFLCNVAQFTPSEAKRLRHYAAAGGGIVFFLGDRVMPDAYNRILNSGRISDSQNNNPQSAIRNPQSAPLLPARIGALVTQPQFGLDPLDYRHPIVAPFRGRERAGLLTAPVARYYQMVPLPSRPDIEIVAATRNGDPFIVAAPLGRGRTILVATDGSLSSVDPASGEPWTTWPTWPSFLPIVREMLAYAAGRHDAWQQPVGTTLGGPIADVARSPPSPNLQIKRPDGRTAPVNVQTSPGAALWSYNSTEVSGIYSLRGLSGQEVRQFAVNVDTAESDLEKTDPQTMPPQLAVRDVPQESTGAPTSNVLSHAAWNEQLLWLALALLFVESFLAWQFGRGVA